MTFKRLLPAFAAIGIASADLDTDLGLVSGDTLVWGGDSITSANMYSHYLAAWFQLTYPELDLKTYADAHSGTSLSGWWGATPADTVANGTVSEYEKHVYPYRPDVVFMMHGHNGGQTTGQHSTSYTDLWEDWVDGVSAAKLVILGMHPSQAATDSKNAEGKADVEATLAGTSANIFHAHTWDQMGATWLTNDDNAIDVQQLGAEPFTTSGLVENDAAARVHPGPAGHIVIAWAVLQGLGAETVVSNATLNAATSAEVSSNNCTISSISLTTTGGTFDRLDGSLPWAIDEAGRTNAVALYSAIAEWQDYSITITNHSAGSYTIKCDGLTIGTATHTELAAGWNMADLTVGPVFDQCQNTLDAIRDLHGFDPDNGDKLAGNENGGTTGDVGDYQTIHYVNGGDRGATYLSSMDTQGVVAALSTLTTAVHTAAQPVTRTFSVIKIGTAGNASADTVIIGQ